MSATEAIRYLNSGFVLFIYIYFFDAATAVHLVKNLGAVGVTGASLAFGSIL